MTELSHNSKAMRIGALVIGAVMLGSALLIRMNMPSERAPFAAPDTSTATSTSVLLLDSDNDGTPDWQEILYGSDPMNASSTPTNAVRTTGSVATSSATDTFARALLYQYLNASGNGTQAIPDTQALGQLIAESVGETSVAFTIVLAKDITTTATSDASRSRYKTEYEKTVAPIAKVSEPEITVYGRFATGDSAAGVKLGEIADIYKTVAGNLAKLTVPTDGLAAHLGAVNALGYYAAVLDAMSTPTDDPVESLILLRAYNEAERTMFNSFSALSTYFGQSK